MSAPPALQFLKRPGKPDLAYKYLAANPALNAVRALPALVFLTGFCSDMEGIKALYLADLCAARGQGMLRFDYSGHGQSGGDFMEGTIGAWLDDSLAVIDAVPEGPLLLVGSSMGGWIGLLCALARPARIAGYIGLAAAPDFTKDVSGILSAEQRALLDDQGYFPLPGDMPERRRIVTRRLLEEGGRHCLLDAPIAVDCPVRLIQGMVDTDVPWQTAQRLLDAIRSEDKKAYFVEEGDHRLSTPSDLALLGQMVAEIS